ncbi:hypothetical protein PMAYCL1PPCAC_09784 [Pristionchus mayeri]|uniref:SSD domain-containing protein n=1 Tax=Pristionchus mayeri TaxID=1317129 RepID=A0AAN5CE83_9BILA|nr:hypothetical protein PMAYCL1PPCAC_09784 [Pristionchus mayeri]
MNDDPPRILHHPKRVLSFFLLAIIPLFSYFAIYPVILETDVRRGFAHKNGRSQEEFRRFAEHFGISYEGLELWVVLITAKGGGTLTINQRVLDEVDRLDDHLRNFTMVTSSGEVIESAPLFGGDINHLFKWYRQVYPLAGFSSDINLTYPVAKINEHRLLLASHFFGVNENGTERDAPIETARTMGLWYISNAPGQTKRKQLEEIELDAFKLALNDSFSDVISFEMFADQVANAEMLRGTQETQSLFLVGVVLMILFMMFTFRHLRPKSMAIIIIGAMASPALATASTFAILGWVGATLNSIMCITPFLVMAIGQHVMDDGFLLLHSWRRQRKVVAASAALDSKTADLRARIARSVLLEVAPSMAITSITNTMAFGVGIFSPTPQMSDFCLATAMAILLDFFFEFLVFLPTLALCYEEKEMQGGHHGCGGKSSWEHYTSMLLSKPGKIAVAVLVLTIYTSSFIGLVTLKTGFAPEKTFPSDSRLVSSLAAFDRIHAEYAPLNLITRKVPVANDVESVERYREMVKKIDHQPGCYPEHTQNPVLDFIDWDRMVHNDSAPSYDRLPEYLEKRMMTKLKIVRWESEKCVTVRLDGSNFFVACRGLWIFPYLFNKIILRILKDWSERARSVDNMRNLLDEYPEFDTSLFDYDGTIYDIVISVKEEVVKAVTITFICMVVACVIFIPSLIGASVAAFSMLSITFTMLGSLSHWGATLDPITMINILLAIGFSVDFSAHICYHFYKERGNRSSKSLVRRMSEILEAVGKPIFEASLSTFVCVAPLFLLKIYVFNSFAKTVMLVAMLGLFHGLVIIPVILSFFLPSGIPISTDEEDPDKKRSIESATDDSESSLKDDQKTRLPLLTTQLKQ